MSEGSRSCCGAAHLPNWRQEGPDIDRLIAACIDTIAERGPHGCRRHHGYSESASHSQASGIGCTDAQALASMEG